MHKKLKIVFSTRGQNPMHILGQYGKENSAAIFDLFMECMPDYPIDKPDINGNTGMFACSFIFYNI